MPAGSTTFRVASFNSEAAGSYPAEPGALPGRPTNFAAAERQHNLSLGSMAQQAAQLPHKEKVAGANPARAPIFRSVAEQQLRRAVTALPSGATKVRVLPLRPFLHPTRRQRRTALVRQRAGCTSLWMLQHLRTWRNSRRVGPRSRWTRVLEGAIPSVRTTLSRRGWNVDTADSKPAGLDGPCRCESGRRDHLRPCVEK